VALRVVYVLVLAREVTAAGDSNFFHGTANLVADGHGFVEPFLYGKGIDVPTAAHPPLYPLLLSVVSWFGGTSWHAHRVFGCFLGGITIVLIALIARRLGGDRAGVIAAAIAAVYPVLVATDGALMSEGLYTLLFAAILYVALLFWDRRDLRLGALLGVLIGLTALTRSEALALLPLLAWPLALALEGRRRRIALVAVSSVACLAVLAPWVIRNTSAFHTPTFISNNDSTVLAGANCPEAYNGLDIGQWRFDCISERTTLNEAKQAKIWRREGIDYIRDHAGRLAVVIPVRLLRTWDLYQPRRQVMFAEGRAPWAYKLGVVAYFLLVPLAIAGALGLRRSRRRAQLLIMLSPAVLAVLQSVIAYGIPRFRQGAEISIVVLAALTLSKLAELRARRAVAA
jgi:4-amino-4-deoxy-L-arabinose transferase-like glycosyltransferase